MKILALYKSHGEHYRLHGIAKAFMAAGHSFSFYNPKQTSVYDAFDSVNPDIFIGTTFDLDDDTIRCILEKSELKVVLKGGNWGSLNYKIDHNKYPIVFSNDRDIPRVLNLKDKMNNDNLLIICHYPAGHVAETMGLWENRGGIPVLGLPNAADIIDYGEGKYHPQLRSDISFVGGYWPYKAVNIDKYLLPLCTHVGEYNIKIWGNQPWPIPQYLGVPSDKTVSSIYASAKICPNISEPHSTDFGFDVVERPFKIMSSGGLCLMDDISGAREMFSEEDVVWYKTPDDFVHMIHHLLNDHNKRQRISKQGRKTVYQKHTYFHRVHDLLNKLHMQNAADEVMEVYTNRYYDNKIEIKT